VHVLVAAMLLCVASPALSSTFTFNLDYQLKNTAPTHWLTATFEDVGNNRVKLTMTAADLATTDHLRIKGWYFNISDESLLGQLKFKHVEGLEARSIGQGADAFGTGGMPGRGFDLYFAFPSFSGNSFGENGQSVYFIKSKGLNAEMFNLSNQDGSGDFFSAAKVAGGRDAGVLAAVPIPGAAWMLGTGLFGLVAVRKRNRLGHWER
jgi:hypothetical protein